MGFGSQSIQVSGKHQETDIAWDQPGTQKKRSYLPSIWDLCFSAYERGYTYKLCIYIYIYMEVSWNGGTPKSSTLMGFSLINQPFGGAPIFWKPSYSYGYVLYIKSPSTWGVYPWWAYPWWVNPGSTKTPNGCWKLVAFIYNN